MSTTPNPQTRQLAEALRRAAGQVEKGRVNEARGVVKKAFGLTEKAPGNGVK